MNIPSIINNSIIIAGSACLAFFPASKKRVRAQWAKSAFYISAVVGVAKGVIQLAWSLGWFALGGNAGQLLHAYLYIAGGVVLGLLFSLILSGQLKGTKADMKQPPNTALEPL